MTFDAEKAINWTWDCLAALWLAGYAFTKPAIRKSRLSLRVLETALVFLGFAAMGLRWFGRGWLGARFVPDAANLHLTGFILTLAGVLFACWARLTLGANWSGRPSVKAGHELIVKGPYALARHPIYTGLLLAVAGTALAVGEWRAVLGFLLILTAFVTKIRQEERLMMQTFPDAYPAYRQRVKALVPGLF